MKLEFNSLKELDQAVAQAATRANQEPNQDSYNAAWLYGYAEALRNVADQLRSLDPVEVKILVDGGRVDTVLKNRNIPLQVEVIDADSDCEDYEELSAYQDALLHNPDYVRLDTPYDFSYAHFVSEEDN